MSVELILLTLVALSQITGFTILGVMLYRMWEQTGAVGAATFPQGRRIEEILKDVREELSRQPGKPA
ncbi:MAG: hypothetical protein A3G40_00830 [Deltaproteobacteria bacterium RIFCSPLOWO2_12_FULL_57_22]|nr:MAG: hypothetical protein A3G40_00830 [Deltaproteobacteria bacterium RIFCSPLOWO2_12_FULL_57_22]